jgi:hypothetical protein
MTHSIWWDTQIWVIPYNDIHKYDTYKICSGTHTRHSNSGTRNSETFQIVTSTNMRHSREWYTQRSSLSANDTFTIIGWSAKLKNSKLWHIWPLVGEKQVYSTVRNHNAAICVWHSHCPNSPIFSPIWLVHHHNKEIEKADPCCANNFLSAGPF